jgi:hypothetical protein
MPSDIQALAATLRALVDEIDAKTELVKATAVALIETCDKVILEGGNADALSAVASMANEILENAEGNTYSGFGADVAVEDARELVARSWRAVSDA